MFDGKTLTKQLHLTPENNTKTDIYYHISSIIILIVNKIHKEFKHLYK
jgi:hypothetical protein